MDRNVWRKSTRSGNNGQCLEVMDAVTVIHIRDSKDPSGPNLAVSPAAWTRFIDTVKR